jgi:hypothetical protein
MKKVLFMMVAVVALVAASCSKEAKLNKTMDGTWNVTKVDNADLPTGVSMSITFTKGKKGTGTYSSTTTITGLGTETSTGTYELVDDVTVYMLDNTAGSTRDTLTVMSYSKTDIKFKATDGTIIDAVKQ